jgi:hypothetical protein
MKRTRSSRSVLSMSRRDVAHTVSSRRREPPSSQSMDALPSTVIEQIFSQLSAAECARAACVKKSWRDVTSGDNLWRKFCSEDWLEHSSEPSSWNGARCESFKVNNVPINFFPCSVTPLRREFCIIRCRKCTKVTGMSSTAMAPSTSVPRKYYPL